MYEDWGINLLVVGATLVTIALCVLLHYEALQWLSGHLRKLAGHRRRRVLVGVYALLVLHLLEIVLFGVVIHLLLFVPGAGRMVGGEGHLLMEAIYLSASSYSTVGFGDVTAEGPLRFLVGTESVTGLLLIGWSASFTYIEMEAFWRQR